MLFNRKTKEPQKVRYEIFVCAEGDKEMQLERYKCPCCDWVIKKDEQYKIENCPKCNQSLDWK